MTDFDKFSELDTAKLLHEVDDQIDGDVFDVFSILDPNRVRTQLAANDITISNAAMLDPARFIDEIEASFEDESGGGGGDNPDADYVNADGSFWINSDGTHWVTAP